MNNKLSSGISRLLYSVLIGTLYTYALARTILGTTVLMVPSSALWGICTGCVLFFAAFFFNRYTFLVAGGLLAAVCTAAFFHLLGNGFQVDWYLRLSSYLRDLWQFALDLSPHRPGYDGAIALFIALSISVVAVLCIQVEPNFSILALLGLIVISLPLLLDYDTSRFAQALYLFCVVALLCRRLNLSAVQSGRRRARPGHRRDKKRPVPIHTLTILPLSLAVLGAACLLPRPDQAPSRREASSLPPGQAAVPGYGGGADLSFTSDETLLGGDRTQNNLVMFEVISDSPVYLSAVVRDIYTGYSWSAGDSEWEQIAPLQQQEHLVSDYTPQLQAVQLQYLQTMDADAAALTVQLRAARTQAVLLPPFSTAITFSGNVLLSRDFHGSLRTDEPLRSPAGYEVRYLPWDYADQRMVELLRYQAQSGLSEETRQYLATYLSLPESLPRRVTELAGSLTQGISNPYDQLKVLEEYLTRFPYSLRPGSPPDVQDFVDYFLFDAQEGYCTYYASALAVMARCLGIPTRYVEGYVTPPQTVEGNRYLVTGAQAHAWVEAYFPGFGWVPFEPTAPYYYSYYGDELPDAAQVFSQEMLDEAAEQVEDLGFAVEAQTDLSHSADSPRESPFPTPQEPVDRQRSGSLWFLPIALIAVVAPAGCLWLRMRSLRRLETRCAGRAYLVYYAWLLRLAACCGYAIHPWETALQFAHRADAAFPADGPGMVELAELYSAAAYGGGELSTRDLQLLKNRLRRWLPLLPRRWAALLLAAPARLFSGLAGRRSH